MIAKGSKMIEGLIENLELRRNLIRKLKFRRQRVVISSSRQMKSLGMKEKAKKSIRKRIKKRKKKKTRKRKFVMSSSRQMKSLDTREESSKNLISKMTKSSQSELTRIN